MSETRIKGSNPALSKIYMIKFIYKVKRWCKKCGISNDGVTFYKCKDSKTGRVYTHNICIACRKDQQAEGRRIRYKKNRKEQIRRAQLWNEKNRERYNRNRRLLTRKKRNEEIISYLPIASTA